MAFCFWLMEAACGGTQDCVWAPLVMSALSGGCAHLGYLTSSNYRMAFHNQLHFHFLFPTPFSNPLPRRDCWLGLSREKIRNLFKGHDGQLGRVQPQYVLTKCYFLGVTELSVSHESDHEHSNDPSYIHVAQVSICVPPAQEEGFPPCILPSS